MQLTRHTDYALRVLMYLGAEPGHRASVAEIADYYGVSRNHLVKVVQGLTLHGYISSTRGKHGGMQLAKPTERISIGEVVRVMENHFEIVECLGEEPSTCPLDGMCRLKVAIHRATKHFLKELDDILLVDVLKPNLRRQLVQAIDLFEAR